MKSRSYGWGLVEMLISLALSSLLMLMLTHYYIQIKQQAFFMQKRIAQESRLSLIEDFIRAHLRHAGFIPCGSLSSLTSVDARDGRTGLKPLDIGKSVTLRSMGDQVAMVQSMGSTRTLRVMKGLTFHLNRPLILADCQHAEVHYPAGIERRSKMQVIHLKEPRVFDYHFPVYVGEWIEESFLIKRNHEGVDALFYLRHHHSDELTPLIHDLKTSLEKIKNHWVLHMVWGLDDNQTREIDTRLRNV